MTRAVVTSFHNYCPMYDHKYFNVISDFYLQNFNKYWKDEVDHLYLLDSNWDFPPIDDPKITVIKTDSNLRYYDAYKKVLPDIKEDLVLFMDNDFVIYRPWIVERPFHRLSIDKWCVHGLGNQICTDCWNSGVRYQKYDVVSIYDTCGTYTTDKLNGKNKFCPYFFAARKELLMKYLDVEWGPSMPEHETLGKLTEKMLDDGVRPYEMEEDKTDEGKDLGYYHIRAGSTVSYLLTHKHFGNKETYWEYLKNQPSQELLRHCDWFDRMGGDASEIRKDLDEKNTLSNH